MLLNASKKRCERIGGNFRYVSVKYSKRIFGGGGEDDAK